MAKRPTRPGSDIQDDGKIVTPRWNSYFTAVEDAIFKPLSNFATDAAAAAGGVPIGGLYQNAGAVLQRIV